jgi:hypothetical protein
MRASTVTMAASLLLVASAFAQTQAGGLKLAPRSGAAAAVRSNPATASAAPCPTPPAMGINGTVTPTVTFDRKSGLYTYQYKLTNTGSKDIWDFAVGVTPPVSGVTKPASWAFATFGDGTGSTVVYHWFGLAAIDAPDTGTEPPPANPLKPGASMLFSFRSTLPSGPVPFYSLGSPAFVDPYAQPIPDTATDEEADAIEEENVAVLLESCGSDVVGDFFHLAVLGSTTGPVDSTTVTVDISPGVPAPNPVTPKVDGPLYVAVLSTRTFNAGNIDPASARFGPDETSALAYVVEDVNGDGRPDLYMQFSTLASGIQCQDKVAFLHAKTFQGQKVQGYDSIAPSCP